MFRFPKFTSSSRRCAVSDLILKHMVREFLHLFFPRICPSCGDALLARERVICLRCKLSLPHTGFHLHADNPISRLFWGRVPIHSATAMYYFRKNGYVQELLHQLKYGKQPEIGLELGRWYGQELRKSKDYRETELIVPVPLHPRKHKLRGYNQSEVFSEGLSEEMGCPCHVEALIKRFETETQTRKSRFRRWENVKEVFDIPDPKTVHNKRILLVDDVITTGATIEACARTLFRAGASTVRVASIASPVY